jgi:hypothetical protein
LAWFFARDVAAGKRWGTALLTVALLGSLWPLRAAYIYPKQDFLGAMHYVDAHRKPSEPVVVTGLAIFPYQKYYGRDWPEVQTGAQLAAAHVPGKSTWLIGWSPIYIQMRQGEIWKAVVSEYSLVHDFPGTLGDGIIYVWREKPPTAAAAPDH